MKMNKNKKNKIKTQLPDFVRCGILGWCIEIIFTALLSFRRRERTGMGTTSIYMFFIYGAASFFKPICHIIRKFSAPVRGCIYMLLIFITEYFSGSFLSKKQLCPWNYARSRYHLHGLIRFDYAPLWFFAGLLFEKILVSKPEK